MGRFVEMFQRSYKFDAVLGGSEGTSLSLSLQHSTLTFLRLDCLFLAVISEVLFDLGVRQVSRGVSLPFPPHAPRQLTRFNCLSSAGHAQDASRRALREHLRHLFFFFPFSLRLTGYTTCVYQVIGSPHSRLSYHFCFFCMKLRHTPDFYHLFFLLLPPCCCKRLLVIYCFRPHVCVCVYARHILENKTYTCRPSSFRFSTLFN